MIVRRALVAWVLLWAMLLGGCPRKCPDRFVPLETLVAEYNANAAGVPKLWARAKIRATFITEKGLKIAWGSTSPLADTNGYVMLWKERGSSAAGAAWSGDVNFVLIGREIAELFRVGADAEAGLYYFWYNVGDRSQAWVGRQELAGAPGVRSIPIDPLQLVEVLGVTELPELEPGRLPAVVMTLQDDPCAYVVRYLRPQPETGHLKIWREAYFRWDEQRPRRPFRVKLYDADGLCRVVADVGQYQPVAWDGPAEHAPVMPTDIRMRWLALRHVQRAGSVPQPEEAQRPSSIHVKLSEMSTTHEFGKGVFKLPPGIAEPIQVDAVYGPIDQERLRP